MLAPSTRGLHDLLAAHHALHFLERVAIGLVRLVVVRAAQPSGYVLTIASVLYAYSCHRCSQVRWVQKMPTATGINPSVGSRHPTSRAVSVV